jgi:large subunit ribosomal protein LP0
MVNQAYIDKRKYGERVYDLLDNYDSALLVHCDNVGSKQFMDIRTALRPNSVVLMGKNTLMRKIIGNYCTEKGNKDWMVLHDNLIGNVGVIFTKDDVKDVKTKVSEFVVPAPAKVGSTATCDVTIPAGVTPLEPSQTGFFQLLNIATKINKGAIEILSDVTVVTKGERVGSSAAALLGKMKITPFEYGLVVKYIYDKGALYPAAVLDITDEQMASKFAAGVSNIASISLATKYPTLAAVPHYIVNSYKNVLAISIGTEYTFELAQKVKDYLANPSAFQSSGGGGGGGGGDAAPAAAAAAPVVEEEEEDMGFDLFD